MVGIGSWPLQDHFPGGCVELPDFPVGYDKDVTVSEPNETGIEQWDYFDVNVHKQTAVVAVPYLNVILCGRRNAIAQRRILRCGYCKLVEEYLYLSTSRRVPNNGTATDGGGDKVRQGRRKVDAIETVMGLVHKDRCIRLGIQTTSLPVDVPAAISLPSLDTVRQLTVPIFMVAICFPSPVCHTRTPSSSLLTMYFPFAENVIAHGRPPT